MALTHHHTSAQVPHRELVKESHVRHLYPLAVIIHSGVIVHFSCASARKKVMDGMGKHDWLMRIDILVRTDGIILGMEPLKNIEIQTQWNDSKKH